MTGPRLIEQDNYEVALKLAQKKWRTQDPARQARRCGADFSTSTDETIVTLDFLYRPCEVAHLEGEVYFAGRESQPALYERILVLHYLTSDDQVPASEKIIAYSEIPDGKFYDAAYQKRTKNYLLGVFGRNPELFTEAGRAAGAEPVEMGDIAFKIKGFPHIDLYVVLWKGDDEFPPDASILLEERIQGYLNAEDIAVLGGMAVGTIARAAKI